MTKLTNRSKWDEFLINQCDFVEEILLGNMTLKGFKLRTCVYDFNQVCPDRNQPCERCEFRTIDIS